MQAQLIDTRGVDAFLNRQTGVRGQGSWEICYLLA